MSRLEFPRVPRPEVSIIMVTFGAEEMARRALAAVIANTEPVYETIVVDNASPADLGTRLGRDLANARVLLNEENVGFGPANNQGAALANGELLVFLNSDAFVHPGWLPPLRERFASDPGAGAVSPKILNLDGTLQEAGALLFRNGNTQFSGFGHDPASPAYGFPRQVAYASAACLMVRRRAFFEVGGFDARYAPAYYEDVDLCLSLAEKGYATLYEPRAVVTHARGASSNPENAVRLWHRNNPRFVARWKERLRSLPEYTSQDGDPRLQDAARDAPAVGRILLVSGRFPAAGSEDLGLVTRLSRLYPRSRRTLVCVKPAAQPSDVLRLCELGWEVADAATVARRMLHYDAVVLTGERARALYDSSIARSQPQAPVIDAAERDVEDALALAGLAPQSPGGPGSAFEVRGRPA